MARADAIVTRRNLRTPRREAAQIFPSSQAPRNDAIVVVEERAMIHGLKLAFTEQEIIRGIDERIADHAASIQFKRDEIDGKIAPTGDLQWHEPVEAVQQEIRLLQRRGDVLTMYGDRSFRRRHIGSADALKWANLMPPELPPVSDFDDEGEIRWVHGPLKRE